MRLTGAMLSRGSARPNGGAAASGGGSSAGVDGRPATRRMSPLCIIFAVQVLAFVLLTLGAFTMFTTSRIEHAETVKELLRLRDEKARLEGELGALRRAVGAPAQAAVAEASTSANSAGGTGGAASPDEQLRAHVRGHCAYSTVGWWTYEVCPFASARQFHSDDAKLIVARGSAPPDAGTGDDWYKLGTYAESTNALEAARSGGGGSTGSGEHGVAEAAAAGRRGRFHLLTNGDLCQNGLRRQTEVSLVCGSTIAMSLASMREEHECRYTAIVSLRAACRPGEPPFVPPPSDSAAEAVASAPERASPRSGDGMLARLAGAVVKRPPLPAPPSRYASLPMGGGEAVSEKAAAVVEAFQHSWGGYVKYAWGKDEFQPLGRRAKPEWIGLGLTAVSAWPNACGALCRGVGAGSSLAETLAGLQPRRCCYGAGQCVAEWVGSPMPQRLRNTTTLRQSSSRGPLPCFSPASSSGPFPSCVPPGSCTCCLAFTVPTPYRAPKPAPYPLTRLHRSTLSPRCTSWA